MAFTTIMFENTNTGSIKEAPVGFSWTTLFFGFFPALFRGDWKWALLIFLITVITLGIGGLIFPFIYNKYYIKDLQASGYKATSISKGQMKYAEMKLGMQLVKAESH